MTVYRLDDHVVSQTIEGVSFWWFSLTFFNTISSWGHYSHFLAYYFHQSVFTSLKTAFIVHVPKKSVVSSFNNYHPVALPILIKHFENLILQHIKQKSTDDAIPLPSSSPVFTHLKITTTTWHVFCWLWLRIQHNLIHDMDWKTKNSGLGHPTGQPLDLFALNGVFPVTFMILWWHDDLKIYCWE